MTASFSPGVAQREAQESADLADQAEQSLERYQALLRQLCQGVDQLVTETKCDRSPILELLGESSFRSSPLEC